jgi:hypothetical protein
MKPGRGMKRRLFNLLAAVSLRGGSSAMAAKHDVSGVKAMGTL